LNTSLYTYKKRFVRSVITYRLKDQDEIVFIDICMQYKTGIQPPTHPNQ
jgi:hypothetical protein